MLLLQKSEFSAIPEEHKVTSAKVPFKVDLRDFSSWLNRQNPFVSGDDVELPAHWTASLESFLAAQVEHLSGGVEFTVADLHAVAKISAIILVLDGLDEVADITQREKVIKQIIIGANRLRETSASLQLVITSRPTAFTTSVVFPESQFPHLQLDSLTSPLIIAYAEKWISSRRLGSKDASDIMKIMKQKIEQPHIRGLARNPMQLAILLSLIHDSRVVSARQEDSIV